MSRPKPRTNLRFLCHLGILLIAPALAADPTTNAVVFKDKNLEQAVRRFVIEKRDTDQPLTEIDLANLSTVQGVGMEITDLAGLEKCLNLASLDLARNRIRDLAPLAGLTRIQYLNLASNQVQEVGPLAGIVALAGGPAVGQSMALATFAFFHLFTALETRFPRQTVFSQVTFSSRTYNIIMLVVEKKTYSEHLMLTSTRRVYDDSIEGDYWT